jgi:hypothetical protein
MFGRYRFGVATPDGGCGEQFRIWGFRRPGGPLESSPRRKPWDRGASTLAVIGLEWRPPTEVAVSNFESGVFVGPEGR